MNFACHIRSWQNDKCKYSTRVKADQHSLYIRAKTNKKVSPQAHSVIFVLFLPQDKNSYQISNMPTKQPPSDIDTDSSSDVEVISGRIDEDRNPINDEQGEEEDELTESDEEEEEEDEG